MPPPPTHTSKRAPLFFAIGKFNINIDSIVLHVLLKHHKLKKGSHAQVTTLLNVRTRGAEQWFFTLRINNCSCKVENMTRMAADSPAWPSSLKLGINLEASTSTLCHFFPYSSHTGQASVSWIQSSHWILITLSCNTRHNSDVPSIGWRSWTAFLFPLPKKAEMLSQPIIKFTPIGAPYEAVVDIALVELHRKFAPLPFFM